MGADAEDDDAEGGRVQHDPVPSKAPAPSTTPTTATKK